MKSEHDCFIFIIFEGFDGQGGSMEEEERESLLMNRQGENEERMDDEVFGGIFMLLE